MWQIIISLFTSLIRFLLYTSCFSLHQALGKEWFVPGIWNVSKYEKVVTTKFHSSGGGSTSSGVSNPSAHRHAIRGGGAAAVVVDQVVVA